METKLNKEVNLEVFSLFKIFHTIKFVNKDIIDDDTYACNVLIQIQRSDAEKYKILTPFVGDWLSDQVIVDNNWEFDRDDIFEFTRVKLIDRKITIPAPIWVPVA